MPRTAQEITALVCSHTDYSDTSRILGLYTRELGKIHVLARGVKKKKADLARLELLGEVRAQVLEPSSSAGSRLYTLAGQVELANAFCGLRTDMSAYACAAYASELVMSLMPFEEPDEDVYSYFRAFLAFLDAAPGVSRAPLMTFELRMLSHCGFGIDPDRPDKATARVLDFFGGCDFASAARLELAQAQEDKIEGIIRSALDFHLEKTLKSFSFMKETLCRQKKQTQKN